MCNTGQSRAIKPPLTHNQQIAKLQSRNLIIDDKEFATMILSRINYYRFSGYALGLHNNDRFDDGVTFEQIYNIYRFDKKLRYMILELLETIEITIRTKITYHLVFVYGATGYLDSSNFINQNAHNRFIEEFNNGKKPLKHPRFVSHYLTEYNGVFPLWVGIELFSFGMLSKFYSNLKTSDKKAITASLKVNSSLPITADHLSSWLISLSNLRNICAHFERVYNRPFNSKPKMYKEDSDIDNGGLFALLLVIKRLTHSRSQWNNFFTELQALIEQYNQIDLNCMGFPENWEDVLI